MVDLVQDRRRLVADPLQSEHDDSGGVVQRAKLTTPVDCGRARIPLTRRKPQLSTPGSFHLSPLADAITPGHGGQRMLGFIDHLLAMPEVGDDEDFEQPRSGPSFVET